MCYSKAKISYFYILASVGERMVNKHRTNNRSFWGEFLWGRWRVPQWKKRKATEVLRMFDFGLLWPSEALPWERAWMCCWKILEPEESEAEKMWWSLDQVKQQHSIAEKLTCTFCSSCLLCSVNPIIAAEGWERARVPSSPPFSALPV